MLNKNFFISTILLFVFIQNVYGLDLVPASLKDQLKAKSIQSKKQILDPYLDEKKERGEEDCGNLTDLLTVKTVNFGEVIISKFNNCGPSIMYFETLYLIGGKDKNLSYIKIAEGGVSSTDTDTLKPMRISEIKTDKDFLLWIELYQTFASGYGTEQLEETKYLNGYVFMLDKKGYLHCLVYGIPIRVELKSNPEAMYDSDIKWIKTQIDVDFPNDGSMIIKKRTKKVIPEQEKWLGVHKLRILD